MIVQPHLHCYAQLFKCVPHALLRLKHFPVLHRLWAKGLSSLLGNQAGALAIESREAQDLEPEQLSARVLELQSPLVQQLDMLPLLGHKEVSPEAQPW